MTLVSVVDHTPHPASERADWLTAKVRRTLQLAGVTQAQLTVAIVNDHEMAQLHEQYTGVSGTTDVLTFDLAGQAAGDLQPAAPADRFAITRIEGDIVVCLDEAARQASRRGHPVDHELLLYAVHGVLHLLGEDDHDAEDYARMHAREDELLEQLGIGRLFNPDPQPPEPTA